MLSTSTYTTEKDEIVQDNSGKYRVYHIKSIGKSYPSVNTILSAIEPKEGLKKWQKYVGKKKAEEIRVVSAERGNAFHKMSEQYLLKEEVDKSNQEINCLFSKVQPFVEKIKPIGIEQKTYWIDPTNSDYGFAGTPDLIATINKSQLSIFSDDFIQEDETTNFIGDWKTWNKLKTPIALKRNGEKYYPLIKYCLQLSAYIAAINQRTNKKYMLSEIIIIGVTEQESEPFYYYWNTKSVVFYWTKFKEIIKCFYNKEIFDWDGMCEEARLNGFLGERIYLVK